MAEGLELAQAYHAELPERIREYLRIQRGISDAVIGRALLGWDGRHITIPIFDRTGLFAFFKLAKDPEDASSAPKMLAPSGTRAELYGWERVREKPQGIIICEGEFDRLVLESRGFHAVTSTGGANTFRSNWAAAFREIPKVYLCFDQDQSGEAGAKKVARLISHAQIVTWPEEVGEGGDVTDFFVRLGRGEEEFRCLLEEAQTPPVERVAVSASFVRDPKARSEVDEVKRRVRIEDIASRYVQLRPGVRTYTGKCPFHDDQRPSFTVYPESQTFYCFGCRTHGDVITLLMRIEKLTFPEALKALEQLAA
jgi:DNA primase